MAHEKLWSSDVAQTCYFHERDEVRTGKVGTAVAGVMSCYKLDVEYYDGEDYRDSFDGDSITPGTSTLPSGDYITLGTPTATAPLKFTEADIFSSMSDEIGHIPPRNELKKQTWLEFWSGDGTGSILYFVKQDKLSSYSVADGPPVFIG